VAGVDKPGVAGGRAGLLRPAAVLVPPARVATVRTRRFRRRPIAQSRGHFAGWGTDPSRGPTTGAFGAGSQTGGTSPDDSRDDDLDLAAARAGDALAAALGGGTLSSFLEDAIDGERDEGRPVSDEAISHLSPGHYEPINPYGTLNFDVAGVAKRPRRSLRRS